MTEQKIWLTSDWHFNHDKEFIWEARGFNSIEEMNQEIVKRHNAIVSPDDIVYVVGDCCMSNKEAENVELIRSMNGHKMLAFGNHDTDRRIQLYKENDLFEDYQMGYRIRYKKKEIVITHYPTITSNGSNRSVINLFGHTHQSEDFYETNFFMYNIGVDAHGCAPVLIDDAMEDIARFKKFLGGE